MGADQAPLTALGTWFAFLWIAPDLDQACELSRDGLVVGNQWTRLFRLPVRQLAGDHEIVGRAQWASQVELEISGGKPSGEALGNVRRY
jgi:hypothetical protein